MTDPFQNMFSWMKDTTEAPPWLQPWNLNPLNPIPSAEEIEQRIKALESIAQWLNLNLQMTQATIQQLHLQKQTVNVFKDWQHMTQETLKQWQNNVGQTETAEATHNTTSSETANETHAETQPTQAFEQMAHTWWNSLQQQWLQLVQPLIPDPQNGTEQHMPTPEAKHQDETPEEPTHTASTVKKASAKTSSKTTNSSTKTTRKPKTT